MSTGYGWEGIRQVCATLLGARHVPERLCSGPCPQRGAIASARPYLFWVLSCTDSEILHVLVLLIPPYSTLILGVFPLHQIAHVGVNVSRYLKLFGREIMFEVFQPM